MAPLDRTLPLTFDSHDLLRDPCGTGVNGSCRETSNHPSVGETAGVLLAVFAPITLFCTILVLTGALCLLIGLFKVLRWMLIGFCSAIRWICAGVRRLLSVCLRHPHSMGQERRHSQAFRVEMHPVGTSEGWKRLRRRSDTNSDARDSRNIDMALKVTADGSCTEQNINASEKHRTSKDPHSRVSLDKDRESPQYKELVEQAQGNELVDVFDIEFEEFEMFDVSSQQAIDEY